MGNDSPQQKASGKGSEAAKPADTHGAEPSGGDHGIANAARDAWSGISKWGHKAADTVSSTTVKAYNDTKDYVKSEKGQEAIKKTREGAAKAIETVGGHGDNKTVNQVVGNAGLIPGVGNVVRGAEALSESGVTGIVRDGKGHVNKDRLIKGAVEVAPVSGEAARLKQLSDKTGLTGKIVETVQDHVNKPGDKGSLVQDAKQHVTMDKDKLIKGAVDAAPVPQQASMFKRFLDKTGLTHKIVEKAEEQANKPKEKDADVQVQERQKIKR